MPDAREGALARGAHGGALAGAVLPRGVYTAARSEPARPRPAAPDLHAVVQLGRRNAEALCRGSEVARRRARRHDDPAHLEPNARAASTRALPRQRRWLDRRGTVAR